MKNLKGFGRMLLFSSEVVVNVCLSSNLNFEQKKENFWDETSTPFQVLFYFVVAVFFLIFALVVCRAYHYYC